MSYSAVDDVVEAYEATRALLLPFDLRRWLTLAVVVFFVSGATGFDLNSNVGFLDAPAPVGPGPGSAVGDPGFGAFVALASVAVLVALVVAFVAAVMEFVFVRVLERRDVRVRPYFRPNVEKAVSLFVLRILLGLVVLASLLFVVAFAVGGGVAFLAVILLLSPAIVIALLALYLFHRFTVDFVVPIMLVDDVGVLGGWRRLLPELRAGLPEYGVYALVRFALGILASVVTGIGFTVVALAVGVPFALVGAALYAVGVLLNASAAVGTLLWVVAALYAVAAAVVGVTFVQVPVSSYLRYYSLLVLADVSPAYDLVSRVRSHPDDWGPPPTGGGGGSGGPGGTAATGRDEEEAIVLPEDVTETRPDAGSDTGEPRPREAASGSDDGEGGGRDERADDDGSRADDPGAEEPEAEEPERDDQEAEEPESDDSETDEPSPYRTVTEEPERYHPDEDDDDDEGR